MTDDIPAQLDALGRPFEDRPFGNTDRISGQTLQPFSFGLGEGARNLLTKAVLAVRHDETERATHYLNQALALPYDEHEESLPAAVTADQLLYDVLSDAVEESSEDEDLFLRAALTVLDQAPPDARPDWAHAMVVMAGAYRLPPEEDRRLRAATKPYPVDIELRDLQRGDEDVMRSRVFAAVHCAAAYLDALEEG